MTTAPDFCARMIGSTARSQGREAKHIGLEHRPDVGVVAFLDRREIAIAGVVDEDVDAAEAPPGGLDGGFDLGLLLDVEFERQRPLAVVADEIVDLRLVARGDHDAIAALEQDLRQLPAEAGRAAGNEPNGFGRSVRHNGLERLEIGEGESLARRPPGTQRLPY